MNQEVAFAKTLEDAGVDAITVHGRTRDQYYSGKSDREIIRKVKQSLHIPVIANGDITSGDDALTALSVTGADGIMIGRGAIGNPFVFSEIKSKLSGGAFSEPSTEEKIEVALLQLSLAIEEKGEGIAVREARKQIALYLRSFKGAALIRAEINRAETYSEVERAMRSALL